MISWLMAARTAHPFVFYLFISTLEIACIWYIRKALLWVASWYRSHFAENKK